MADGKKTYFQVSFTGGQALLAVVALIVALGLAFFFGAKAGFERAAEPEPAPAARETRPGAVPAPVTTTEPAPALSSTASSNASATEEAPVFEDREAGVSEEPKAVPGSSTTSSPSRTEIAGLPSSSAIAAPPKQAKGEKPSSTAPAGKAPVSSASDATATKSVPAAAKKGGYFVQILSTASKSEASRWKDRLAAKSYHSAAVTTVDSKKGKLYRVRTGPYPNRAQANKIAAKINAEFRQKAWVASE